MACHYLTRQVTPLLRRGVSPICCNFISNTAVTVWEPNKTSRHETLRAMIDKKQILKAMRSIWPETKRFKDECVAHVLCDFYLATEHGDYEYFYKFNDKESIDRWIVTTDRDNKAGYSVAQIELSQNNTAIFSGNLCTDLPKDGVVERTGYCNVHSPVNTKSFHRIISYDWTRYTHLILRVRGDGRTYALNVNMNMYFDVNWYDQFSFALFTRGGPYWQTAKIPFSKFYKAYKGRIQDKQQSMILDRVLHLGITVQDCIPGPFELEIDYIAMVYDENHREESAYEMYFQEIPVFD